MKRFVRVTIIIEPENIHVYGSDVLEIEIPADAEELEARLAATFTNALSAMERAIEAKPAAYSVRLP